ncbi:MAG: hypothetical protein AABW72_05685 [archaeon]
MNKLYVYLIAIIVVLVAFGIYSNLPQLTGKFIAVQEQQYPDQKGLLEITLSDIGGDTQLPAKYYVYAESNDPTKENSIPLFEGDFDETGTVKIFLYAGKYNLKVQPLPENEYEPAIYHKDTAIVIEEGQITKVAVNY